MWFKESYFVFHGVIQSWKKSKKLKEDWVKKSFSINHMHELQIISRSKNVVSEIVFKLPNYSKSLSDNL